MSDTLKPYLATFILDFRHTELAPAAVIENLKNFITQSGAKDLVVNDLGKREFVRVTDKKNPAGHYVQITFKAPSTAPTSIKEKTRFEKYLKNLMIQANETVQA